MKHALFAAIFSIGVIQATHGLSLDVGGIELSLGQDVSEAINSLSGYQVTYHDGLGWVVQQNLGNQVWSLGHFSAVANKIVYISKSFNDREATAETYTRASKELHARGGNACTLKEIEYSDGKIHSFNTSCGAYLLRYSMPSYWRPGELSQGSIDLSLKGRP